MTVAEAKVEVLPGFSALIGDRKLASTTGEVHVHVYAATGKPTVEVALAGPEEVDAAVRAARAALPAWRTLPADRRRGLMLAFAQEVRRRTPELADLVTAENGAPYFIAQMSPPWLAELFEYNAGWADKVGGDLITTWPDRALDYALDEPYGVVGVILPWNGPLVGFGQSLAPALAAGNVIVIKPPELAPFTSLRLGELALEVGFPPGVVNVVPGGPVAGQALAAHPGVDKLHFTGSGATAKKILATCLENLTPVGLELGGKSANIIFADADLEAATGQVLPAILNMCGQGCINGTRILVEDPVYDEVVERIAGAVGSLPVGDPTREEVLVGPVISQAACDRIMGVIGRARDERQGRLVAGGGRKGGELSDGYFVEPTVFADVDNAADIARHEIFGPVLSVLRFRSDDEAIAMANDSPYGLAAYVQTRDVSRAHLVAQRLESGMVWVNGYTGIPSSAPFGGVKQSGTGRVGGRLGIQEFVRAKNVWIAL